VLPPGLLSTAVRITHPLACVGVSDRNEHESGIGEDAPWARPIFVVGCARSGTTLVQLMLDSHPRIACGPETLFLEQLVRGEENNWARLAAFGITKEMWRSRIRDLFSWVHVQHAEQRGKVRWADKSPGYTRILGYLDDLYPDCQVIQVIRHPRDVIDSWARRWGPRRAHEVVHVWPDHIRAGRAFASTRSPDRYREIRYEDLVADPATVMHGVIDWLGEAWDDDVMRFGEIDHGYGRGPLDQAEAEARWLGALPPTPSVSSTPSTPLVASTPPAPSTPAAVEGDGPGSGTGPGGSAHVFTSSVGVGRRPLSTSYLAELRARSGPLLRELGYSWW
jgi:hypothetical protein